MCYAIFRACHIRYVWGNLVVSLPARSAGKFWAFLHHFVGFRRVAPENFGPLPSVSGKIPARSAGKFWGICLASVKFSHLEGSARSTHCPPVLVSDPVNSGVHAGRAECSGAGVERCGAVWSGAERRSGVVRSGGEWCGVVRSGAESSGEEERSGAERSRDNRTGAET